MMTLSDKEYQLMRDPSVIFGRLGGNRRSNIQFATNPENGRMVVIEMNPRVYSSALHPLQLVFQLLSLPPNWQWAIRWMSYKMM